jgi:hypothetical protein
MALLSDRRFVVLLIAIGVMMLVALTLINFSGAYFTSSSRSPGNEFAAGAVAFELSEAGQVVNGAGMVPGNTRSGDQTVTNTGHKSELFLEVLHLDTRSPLAAVLNVRVRQTEPPHPQGSEPAYDGRLVDMRRVPLGTLGHDAVRTYTITVEWPERDDDRNLRGEQTSLDFKWELESVP